MMSALLIGAAPVSDIEPYRAAITDSEVLVAIDGGLGVYRRLDVRPDVLIGDLDSVDQESLDWVRDTDTEIIVLPVAKNVSDLDAALALAHDRGWDRITVGGVLGGRPDHTLAAIGSLVRRASLDVRLIGETDTVFLLDETRRPSLSLEGKGLAVSLVAPLESAVVTLEGFEFPLVSGALQPLESLGLSNVTTSMNAIVTVHTGRVLVFVSDPLDA